MGPGQLPAFEEALLPGWHRLATLGPGALENAAKVLVWFTDHWRYPLCHAPREVHLYDDVTERRFLIAQAWREQIDIQVELRFSL